MAPSPEMTVKLTCASCGEVTEEPVERIVADDVIPCAICGGLIDLMDPQFREQVQAARKAAGTAAR